MSSRAPFPTPTVERSRLATAVKRRADPRTIEARRRDLAAANIAAAIDRALKSAPDLTEDQADRLAALLRGSDCTSGGAKS